MPGEGPFLWLGEKGSPRGWWRVPPGGMCLSAFLFVRQGDRILLGKYADDPRWDDLAGLDATRRRAHGHGWTIPASHLKYGEDPREAGRRIAEDVLRMPSLRLSEPRVETEFDVPARFPELGRHYDVWFLLDAEAPEGAAVEAPPWYREWAWLDPRALAPEDYGRSHGDVAARWLAPR